MRITNQLLTNNFIAELNHIQTQLARLQRQSSTGKAFEAPRDNPAGVATSLDLHAALAYLTQYSRNADDGLSRLTYTDTVVSDVNSQIQRIRELTVQGSNSY